MALLISVCYTPILTLNLTLHPSPSPITFILAFALTVTLTPGGTARLRVQPPRPPKHLCRVGRGRLLRGP